MPSYREKPALRSGKRLLQMATQAFKAMHDEFEDIHWKQIFSLKNAMNNIFNIIGAVVVMLIAHVVGSFIAHIFSSMAKARQNSNVNPANVPRSNKLRKKLLHEHRTSIMLDMMGRIAYVLSLLIGFLIMMRIFGFQIATIVTALGTIILVITFALQGTFSDVASGVLLAFFQTYDLGDIINLNNMEGRVVEFGVLNTLLEDLSTRALITVPNTIIQSSIVTNFSKHRNHMFVFDIALSAGNWNFAEIKDAVDKDLQDEKKYPAIVKNPVVKGHINVHDLSGQGTVMRVSVPFLVTPDLSSKRNSVRNGVKNKLDELRALKLDNAYDYMVFPENKKAYKANFALKSQKTHHAGSSSSSSGSQQPAHNKNNNNQHSGSSQSNSTSG